MTADADVQRRERIEHVAGVVAVEEIADARGTLGQRGQQQNPVRNALRTRQLHYARDVVDRIQSQGFHRPRI